MVRETNKRTDNPVEFEAQVRERIMALSRSHDLLVSADWKGANLRNLIEEQIKPFPRGDLISMSGPGLILSPNAVQYLGMAFHELCTNSAKYGVLAGHAGSLQVTWDVQMEGDQPLFTLAWLENDGPTVKAIGKAGFGSVVLKRVAPQGLRGVGELHYDNGEILWQLSAPAALVKAGPYREGAI